MVGCTGVSGTALDVLMRCDGLVRVDTIVNGLRTSTALRNLLYGRFARLHKISIAELAPGAASLSATDRRAVEPTNNDKRDRFF